MMTYEIERIEHGTVTSPQGFQASGVSAGIKSGGKLDLGLLVSEARCAAAGVFTTNVIKGASLLVTRDHLQDGCAQAILANSGNANACTGERGIQDAETMSRTAAERLRLSASDVLPNSTGVIGNYLPLEGIIRGIEEAARRLRDDGGEEMARAIMTTDTVPKFAARRVAVGGETFTLGGIAKGSGMIHPNLATMFAFLTTDARVNSVSLRGFLKEATDDTFNRLTIDGDTSCDDTVLLLANGLSMKTEIAPDESLPAQAFREALRDLCLDLTRQLARDGEGVTKVVTLQVRGAKKREEALQIARTVAVSCLVKTAFHGQDPNWGRIITSAGAAGVGFDPGRVDLWIGDIRVMRGGERAAYQEEDAAAVMQRSEYEIVLHLNQGDYEDFYITTDLSNAYIDINADYRHRT